MYVVFTNCDIYVILYVFRSRFSFFSYIFTFHEKFLQHNFFFFFFFLNKDAITVEFPPSNSIQTLHLHLFQSSNLAVYTHRQHVAGSSTVVLGEG